MKRNIAFTILILVVFISNAQTLLREPQKVVIDALHNRYLVSNYQTGDIVQIDSAGNQDYFIQGANFVDGLEIVGDTVFGVGQNRRVKAYNLSTKQLIMDIKITGSNSYYLSSITSDSAGHLFISCPALHTIYKFRISDQSYWIFAENNGLNRPNGILLEKEKNRIVVIDDCPAPSNINAISLLDSTVSCLKSTNFNRPDGIVRDKHGFYYVGGYYLPGVYRINPDFSGDPELIFTGSHIVYPTYHEDHNSLLVTYYGLDDWGEFFLPPTFITSNEIQNSFALLETYPNPFTDQVNINFEIKENTHARLEVINQNGETINILVNEFKPLGKHSITWNGKNQYGKQAPDGTYFIRLTNKGITDTLKVILINN